MECSMEYDFKNRRGINIFCKYWNPESGNESIQKTVAVVFLIHGLAEHSGRYKPLVKLLMSAGIAVITHDHQGHGRSEGRRIWVDDFEHYVDDIHEHLTSQMSEKRLKDLPLFLIGHSMGGLISLMYAIRYPEMLKGVILIAPALSLPVNYLQICILRMVAYVKPTFSGAKLVGSDLCHDEEKIQETLEDPLNFTEGVDANWLVKCYDAIQKVFSQCEKLTRTPILNFHGDADMITPLEGSTRFHSMLNTGDNELKVVTNAYHQIHNEPMGVGIKCMADSVDWIIIHI